MSDIKNEFKSKLEEFENAGSFLVTRSEIVQVITTIESQKEEIEKQEEIIEQYTKVMNDRKLEFESLKAITELAVKERDSAFEFITKLEEQLEWFTTKTLKSIESFMEPKVMDREPIATGDQRFYETERLQNG